MSLQLSGDGVVAGLDSVASSDLGSVLGSKLDLAGGKILQIVRATDNTGRTTTSSTDADAGISVTITPQKNDSAVLLLWVGRVQAPSGAYLRLKITDSSNNNISGAQGTSIGTTTSLTVLLLPAFLVAYDTPATVSATTYKVRFNVTAGSGTIDNVTQTGQMYAIEVSA